MHYLLFNSEVIISDGQAAVKTAKGRPSNEALGGMDKVRICCVDADVMVASAPGAYLEKKDALLAQKFAEVYSHEYITLDEKIADNIFQVVGIKAGKVKEIYSIVPSAQVDAFVPYATALRALLEQRRPGLAAGAVFVDDLEGEILITVFDGLKFSRTRTVAAAEAQDILPDILRSHIDFNKKLGEFASKTAGELVIITNNGRLAENIRALETGLTVDFLDCRYPALEGLKFIDSQIKYRIHEEIILESNKKLARSRARNWLMAGGLFMGGILFFGCNQIIHAYVGRGLEMERSKNVRLKEELGNLDRQVYRLALRRTKNLNYSGIFFQVSGLLPGTYGISAFRFTEQADHWSLDAYLLAQDKQFYEEIPRVGILKNARIKDFFIQNHPGKYLKVVL